MSKVRVRFATACHGVKDEVLEGRQWQPDEVNPSWLNVFDDEGQKTGTFMGVLFIRAIGSRPPGLRSVDDALKEEGLE